MLKQCIEMLPVRKELENIWKARVRREARCVMTNDTEAFKCHELSGTNKELSAPFIYFISLLCPLPGGLGYYSFFIFCCCMVILLERGVQEITYPNAIITFQITSVVHVQFAIKYKCELLESNESRGIAAKKSVRAR